MSHNLPSIFPFSALGPYEMTYLCISSGYFWAIPSFSLGFPSVFLFCCLGSLSYLPSLLWVLAQKCRKKPRLGGQVKIKAAQEVSFPGLMGQEDIWQMSKQRPGCRGCCVPAARSGENLCRSHRKVSSQEHLETTRIETLPSFLSRWLLVGVREPGLKSQRSWGSPELLHWGLCTDLFLGHLLCFSLIGFL